MSRTVTSIVVVVVCSLFASRVWAAEPTITIAGAPKVTLTLPEPVTWTQTYYVYVDSTPDAVVEQPTIQKLQDASGRQVDVTATVEPAVGTKSVAGKPLVYSVTLSATLQKAATYTTTLRATSGPKFATKEISVEVLAAVAVAAQPPAHALVQIDKSAKNHEDNDQIFGDEPETVVLTVRNNSDKDVEIGSFDLVMTRKTAATHSVDVAASGSEFGVDGEGQVGHIIPANGDARVHVTLNGLEIPGEYNGLLRIVPKDPSVAPLDLELSVFLRQPWFWCALLIALGAITAYLVRNAQDITRVKQVRRVQLATSLHQLSDVMPSAATSHAVALGRGLERQARDINESIGRSDKGLDDEAKSPIKLFGERVRLFERFVVVDADVARLPADARDTKRTALDGVAAVISNSDSDSDAIENASDALKDLQARDAVRSWLKAWLKSLEVDVASHAASGDAELTKAINASLVPALGVARAQAKDDALDKLQSTLDGIQRDLINHGALALERGLKQAPVGIAADAWTTMTASVSNKLASLKLGGELQTLISDYAEARVGYMIAVGRGAAAAADDFVANDQTLSTGVKDQIKKLRDAVVAAYENATPDAAAIARAITLLRAKVLEGGGKISGTTDGFRPPEMSLQPGYDTETEMRVARGVPPPPSRDWQDLQIRLQRTDLAIFMVVAVIGILAGLKLLWVGNATWGGWVDAITAFVWGAGVNASKDGFMGLMKLRNDLGKV